MVNIIDECVANTSSYISGGPWCIRRQSIECMVFDQYFLQNQVRLSASHLCRYNVIKIPFFLSSFCRDKFTNEHMAMVCLACTLIAILPSCLHLLFNAHKTTFVLSLINTSLAFFLFSFQVRRQTHDNQTRFDFFFK